MPRKELEVGEIKVTWPLRNECPSERERLWAVRVGFLEEVVRRGRQPHSGSHTRTWTLSHPPLPLLSCVVSEKSPDLSEPQFAPCQLALIPHPCWGPCERTCRSTFDGGLVSGKRRPGPSAQSGTIDFFFLPGIHVGQNGDSEIHLTAHRTHRVLDSKQSQGPGPQKLPQTLQETFSE